MPARKILSEGQWKLLLDYMEANPKFAKGIAGMSGPEAKQENHARWKRLASRLNNVGNGCTKNYIQWRDYWNNTKYVARKKVCNIRKQLKRTMNGENLERLLFLTKNEKRVLTSLGIPIPLQLRMTIKSPPVSPPPNASSPPSDASPPPAAPSLVVPPLQIKTELDSPHSSSLILETPPPTNNSIWVHTIGPTAVYDSTSAPNGSTAKKQWPLPPDWARHIEERRIAAEERSAQALQAIQANTELCVNALQGIQYAQECLNKTMQSIQAALETLQEPCKKDIVIIGK